MIAEQITFEPAVLGEGPCWHAEEQVLYWVDIWGRRLHRFDPATGDDTSWEMGQMIGTVAPRRQGGLIVALQHGYATFDPATGELQHQPAVDPSPATRFNDGKCDPSGRFWCGTLDLEEASPIGALYRSNDLQHAQLVLDQVTISNGMGWNPACDVMYYIDSPTRTVEAFDYQAATGEISNRRVVIELGDGEGFPDGMTTDREGMIWLAHWAGARVCRWNPHNGQRLELIEVPAPHTSACCFGGERLTDLYVTTARKGLTAEQLEAYPNSGCLFRIRTNVVGSETHAFAG